MMPVIHKIIRKDRIINGKVPVMLQVYYKGMRKQFSTGLKIEVKYWDEKNECALNKAPNASWFNQMLRNQYNELEKKYFQQQIEKGAIDLNTKEKKESTPFAAYGYKVYDNLKNNCSPGYIMRAKSVISDFKRFAGDVNFSELTVQVLKDYENSMFKRGLHVNTINRHFKRLSQVCKDALKNKVIVESPFTFYRIVSYRQTQRIYLTMEEVKQIEGVDFTKLPEQLQNVVYAFLLSCYTGLRYGDLKNFDKEKAIVKINNIERLIVATSKTGENVSIKINAPMKKYLDLFNGHLPVNQTCNEYLKLALLTHRGISKDITFHCARHSFATNALALKIPLNIIQKWLAHRNIKTTGIYAQIIDTLADEYSDMWG